MQSGARRVVLWSLCLMSLPAALVGQTQEGVSVGPYDVQGSVTAGYRFTDVGGRQQKFNELYYLQSGFRLMDFNLTGKATEGQMPFADNFSLNVSGLGGDPFPSAQFTMRKINRYDLRLNFRQSYYYWDRNDNVLPPAPAGFSQVSSLTSFHDFATVRKFGSANLAVHVANNVRLIFDYSRNTREGANFTTRNLEYVGMPSVWESFLRSNPYYVDAPMDDKMERFTTGISYSPKNWSLHYQLGYQKFNQLMDWHNVTSPQGTFNTTVNGAQQNGEQLSLARYAESRELNTPVSEFSFSGRPTKRLDLRGGHMFYRYSGPAAMDALFQGTARTNSGGTAFAPYDIRYQARSELREPNHVGDLGATVKLTDWWNLHGDYRYSRFTVYSLANFEALRDSLTQTTGEAEYLWRYATHQGDVNFEFIPRRGLIIRPGLRFIRRDVQVFEDAVLDPARSRLINSVWPTLGAYFQPHKKFSVRGDFQSITSGASYTRISPHTDVGGRAVFRFKPTEKLSIENSMVIRSRKFVETDFENSIRINSVNIAYDLNDRFAIFGGFSYDSWFATASVAFQRGTPPPQQTCSSTSPCFVTWRDQTVNRVWSAGLALKPSRYFGFNFSGNYLRTTGAGEISGEPPYFGPLTWPMGTGTVWVEFPKAGRLSLDLQRTYYLEEIIRGNDFNASILAIRWTRDF